MPGEGLDFSALAAASIHDLKNSVALLELQVQALQDAHRDVDLLPVQSELGRLRQQLVELMAVYRLREGSYPLMTDECFLDEVLEELELRNRTRLQGAGVGLQYQADPAVCWPLDRQLVAALLDNLLHNAIKQGSGTVTVEATERIVDGRRWLSVMVSDQGEGFPPSMLGELAAEAGALDWQRGNTGFGLYFCALAARQHRNGDYSGRLLISNSDAGGRVELLLP